MADRPVRVGVDTGGTFTDAVFPDGSIAKVLSTPSDPASAVGAAMAAARPDELAHGTTVATNALLERRGARLALVTDPGFEDVIEIGRQNRPALYDGRVQRPVPLVPRELRVGAGIPVPSDVDGVAVCLLDADLDPSAELAVADELRASGLDVTCSHEVSPEFREFERTVTTVIDAYLRPPCRDYLLRLAPLAARVLVLRSAGGLVPLEDAAVHPAGLLLSGPAGGVRAGAAAASAAGFPDAVTFDMGGTSTDVCLVLDGRPAPAAQRSVEGFPVRLPSLDVHTIGAGGGSIARIDAGGALVVGPQSAGADPGPACYGRGGTQPTVTDADLVAGRIPADAAFPGLDRLDRGAAQRALDAAGVTADGVIKVVDAAMVQAVRAVSVAQGVDPSGLALVAFGGAGPLHACAIAEELGMAAVVVPPRAGVLSAVGILGAPRQVDLVRSWPDPTDHAGATAALHDLANAAAAELEGDVHVEVALDCRYAGQSHELQCADVDDFHEQHRRRNGFARLHAPVEVVALRATATTPSPVDIESLAPPRARQPALGPGVLSEPDCTVWVPDGWSAEVGGGGAWILQPSRS
ncbi:MAG TPA: hydantoinase/oxoprolinase family protein [Acidimicrobiales bacterium]|nr:hydantoinase/oxoprolinase family protein [Acidimicrobiales bacterium]